MAQIVFNEGKNLIGTSGLPGTCYFLLSTRAVSTHAVTDTLAGGVGEITGTGYTRKSQAEPSPTAGEYDFAQMSWDTDVNTDWSATVRSAVLVSTSDDTGAAIAAWDLGSDGSAATLDMSGADNVLNFTPTLLLQNEGGG